MNKRPKSREETPKEGSDRARPYRTATICGRAAQNARVFGLVRSKVEQAGRSATPLGYEFYISKINALHGSPAEPRPHCSAGMPKLATS
jgi:hypothetical protein